MNEGNGNMDLLVIEVAENKYRVPAIDNRTRTGRSMSLAVYEHGYRFGTMLTRTGKSEPVFFDAMGWTLEHNLPPVVQAVPFEVRCWWTSREIAEYVNSHNGKG